MKQPRTGGTAIHVAALAEKNGWRREAYGETVEGLPLIAWWPGNSAPTRVVWAAIHGEEAVTLQLAHQLLRTVRAQDACAVVIPVANPDGVLHATRQNARGIDLNRNFPSAEWQPTTFPTYWPTALTRTSEHRNQWSSAGESAGSEPEVRALCDLIERIQPTSTVDLHTPLECVIAPHENAQALAQHLAEPCGLPIKRELESPTPGDAGNWCAEHGIIAVTYETEMLPFGLLWHRHSTALARAITSHRSFA